MRHFGQLVKDMGPGFVAWLVSLMHGWDVTWPPWAMLGGPWG